MLNEAIKGNSEPDRSIISPQNVLSSFSIADFPLYLWRSNRVSGIERGILVQLLTDISNSQTIYHISTNQSVKPPNFAFHG